MPLPQNSIHLFMIGELCDRIWVPQNFQSLLIYAEIGALKTPPAHLVTLNNQAEFCQQAQDMA